MTEIALAVRSASEHALLVQEHNRRVYQLLGADGLGFLDRLATNDLVGGPPNRAVATAFCNEQGRLLEAAEIVITTLETFLICSASGSGKLMSWIASSITSEKIQLIDVSAEFSVYSLLGPHVFSIAKRVDLLTADRERQEVRSCMGEQVLGWETMFGSLPSVRVLARREVQTGLFDRLKEAGARCTEGRAVYEFIRVLHAAPEFGHEITEAFTPHEAGLSGMISSNKQEFVGRQALSPVRRHDIPGRELRLLWSDAPEQPRRGTAVVVSGEIVGVVTSSVRAGSRILVLAIILSKPIDSHEVVRIIDYPYVLNSGPVPPFSLVTPS